MNWFHIDSFAVLQLSLKNVLFIILFFSFHTQSWYDSMKRSHSIRCIYLYIRIYSYSIMLSNPSFRHLIVDCTGRTLQFFTSYRDIIYIYRWIWERIYIDGIAYYYRTMCNLYERKCEIKLRFTSFSKSSHFNLGVYGERKAGTHESGQPILICKYFV